jgi:hypothetical protein
MGSPRAAPSREPSSVISYTRISIVFPLSNSPTVQRGRREVEHVEFETKHRFDLLRSPSISRLANRGPSRFPTGLLSCAPLAWVVRSQPRRAPLGELAFQQQPIGSRCHAPGLPEGVGICGDRGNAPWAPTEREAVCHTLALELCVACKRDENAPALKSDHCSFEKERSGAFQTSEGTARS